MTQLCFMSVPLPIHKLHFPDTDIEVVAQRQADDLVLHFNKKEGIVSTLRVRAVFSDLAVRGVIDDHILDNEFQFHIRRPVRRKQLASQSKAARRKAA